MKLATPLTRKTLRDHLVYHGWQYLLILALSFPLWNLIYQQTAYRPPESARIDVYIQSSSAEQDKVNAFLKPIWDAAVPEQELVSAVLMLSPGGSEDYYSSMQLVTYIGAAQGDIYMLTLPDFKRLAAQGAFVALDQYVMDGLIDATGIQLDAGRVTIMEMNEQGESVPASEPRLYGIPAKDLYRFASELAIDNRDMVLAVAVNSGNEESSLTFLNALIRETLGPKPDFFK